MRRGVLVVSLVGSMVAGLIPSAHALSVRSTAREGTAQAAAATAPDGSFYTVGSEPRLTTAVATLTKWSASGRQLWQRHWLPNPRASTVPVSVTVAEDGTVYMLGIARGICEAEGWFVRAFSPGGTLRWKYVTPGWRCALSEAAMDIDVRRDVVVVSGTSIGCCGNSFSDGWVQAFDRKLHPTWRANTEPPLPTPAALSDTASGVTFGASGNMYVSGWAATEGARAGGTPFIEKLTTKGRRIWSVRAKQPMPSDWLEVSIDSKGKRIDVAAGIGGEGIAWGEHPTTGWVASYSPGGAIRWQRLFGGGAEAIALPTGIAIGAHERVWIEGMLRDGSDRGTNVFARTYRANGTFLQKLRIDSTKRYLTSGDLTRLGLGAALTGWVGTRYRFNGGRIWRVA